MKVSWGRVCICASNIVKCYAIILRQVHADLMPFFFFFKTSPLMTMSHVCSSRVKTVPWQLTS